jgi:hypothetical protein
VRHAGGGEPALQLGAPRCSFQRRGHGGAPDLDAGRDGLLEQPDAFGQRQAAALPPPTTVQITNGA